MGWIPEDQRGTDWYLFNKLFQCRVPQAALRTADAIKQFGTPTTGDRTVDREFEKMPAFRMLTIAQMEDIWHRGYGIGVIKFSDTKQIYEYIQDHLLAFQSFFNTQANNRVDPKTLEELDRLDTFASEVYTHAKKIMPGEFKESILARLRQKHHVGNILTRSMITTMSAKAEQAATAVTGTSQEPANVPEEKVYPERQSFSKLFEKQKEIGARTWK